MSRAIDFVGSELRTRIEAEEVLDGLLGSEVGNGAGAGLAADIALVGQQRDIARMRLKSAKDAVNAVLQVCDAGERDGVTAINIGIIRAALADEMPADVKVDGDAK
jgi:hypothetical protein